MTRLPVSGRASAPTNVLTLQADNQDIPRPDLRQERAIVNGRCTRLRRNQFGHREPTEDAEEQRHHRCQQNGCDYYMFLLYESCAALSNELSPTCTLHTWSPSTLTVTLHCSGARVFMRFCFSGAPSTFLLSVRERNPPSEKHFCALRV